MNMPSSHIQAGNHLLDPNRDASWVHSVSSEAVPRLKRAVRKPSKFEKSAWSLLTTICLNALGAMDLRAYGSWMSAPKLFFQDFEDLAEAFDPARLREWPPDVRRIAVQKTFSFWAVFFWFLTVPRKGASNRGYYVTFLCLFRSPFGDHVVTFRELPPCHLCGTCGRPIFIQCWYWDELHSPYEGAKPQPSTG